MPVKILGSQKPTYLGLRGSWECTSGHINLLDLLDFYFSMLFLSHQFFPFGFLIYQYSAMVEVANMGSIGPLLCEWLGETPLIHSGAGECKDCDPCGQLLYGMLQEPIAVQTLHTHSIAAHGRSTAAHNTPLATQWLGQHLCYSLVQSIGYGSSIDIVWRLS